MPSNRDANGYVILDRAACLQRLALRRVASLAITEHALPVVLPVLYTLDDEDIVVGAASTGVLGRRLPGNVVSLCVHDVADDLLSGWTVTVTGRAVPVAESTELRRWAADNSRQVVVRIGTERISGRQILRTE